MMITQISYGPMVFCDFTGERERSQRPGFEGPWFCAACGSTEHPEA